MVAYITCHMINSRVKFQFGSISCSLTIYTYHLVSQMKCIHERASYKALTEHSNDENGLSLNAWLFIPHVSPQWQMRLYKLRKALFMHFHFIATKWFKLLEKTLSEHFSLDARSSFSHEKSVTVNDFLVSNFNHKENCNCFQYIKLYPLSITDNPSAWYIMRGKW